MVLDFVLRLELLQESFGKLLQPLVPILRSLFSDRFDVRFQGRVPPVVPGRLLSIASYTIACRLEQGPGRRGVEAWIIARRQVELATRSTGIVSIVVDKSA